MRQGRHPAHQWQLRHRSRDRHGVPRRAVGHGLVGLDPQLDPVGQRDQPGCRSWHPRLQLRWRVSGLPRKHRRRSTGHCGVAGSPSPRGDVAVHRDSGCVARDARREGLGRVASHHRFHVERNRFRRDGCVRAADLVHERDGRTASRRDADVRRHQRCAGDVRLRDRRPRRLDPDRELRRGARRALAHRVATLPTGTALPITIPQNPGLLGFAAGIQTLTVSTSNPAVGSTTNLYRATLRP